jgi:phosphatidylinositol 4-kinase
MAIRNRIEEGNVFKIAEVCNHCPLLYRIGIIFTTSLFSAQDPFISPIEYSPTGKDAIDHSIQTARRLLLPHTILLQSLSSLFQASRYRHPRVMRILLRLILRSVDAHQSMR